MLQCEVIGNLGNDAEIKDFSGKKYVSFSVAHSEVSKDQQGNRVEQTTWVSVLWYGEGGGLLQYLKRGSKVFVRGRQKVKVYSDKNGNAQCAINVNANEVQLCGIKGETNNAQSDNHQAQPSAPSAMSDSPNDDLPF
jgi:single-strand DNA-binding protein